MSALTDSDGSGLTDREGVESTSVRRLRKYPVALKCRIVEETFVPGASVSIVARRHDVNANLVFEWRKKYRQGTLIDGKAAPALLRIGVVDHDGDIRPLPEVNGHSVPPSPETAEVNASPGGSRPAPGIIEIELRSGIKVRVDVGIDEAALRRVLVVIKDIT